MNLKNTTISLVAGNAVFALAQWGVLSLLAHLQGATAVGEFALAMAIATPIFIFANMGLRLVLSTDTNNEHGFNDYFTIRLFTTLVAIIATLFIGMIAKQELMFMIFAITVAKASESVADIFYGEIQRQGRIYKSAISLILRSILGLFLMATTLFFTDNTELSILALCLGWLAIMLFYDLKLASFTLPKLAEIIKNKNILRKLALTTLPVGITALILNLIINTPRYFIEHELGSAMLGVFAGLSYIILAGNITINALGQAIRPTLANLWRQDKFREFNLLTLKSCALATLQGLGLMGIIYIGGEFLLQTMYGKEFSPYVNEFVAMSFASIFIYVGGILGFAAGSTRHFKRLIIPYLMVLIATGIALLVFIPTYGLMGSAYAMLVTGIASCLAALGVIVRARFSPNI